MRKEKLLSPGRELLARRIIERVGEPIVLSDPETMTEDEAVLVLQFVSDVDRPRAKFIVDMIRGKISGDVVETEEKE